MSEYEYEKENVRFATAKCKSCGKTFMFSYFLFIPKFFQCLCPECKKEKKHGLLDEKYKFYETDVITSDITKGELELMKDFTKAGKIKNWKDWIDNLPKAKGVYAIVYKGEFPKNDYPEFLETGTGGLFKGKNPNVSIAKLKEKWDNNHCDVLYIGRAGKDSVNKQNESTIFSRVKLYMRFGFGEPVAHWGGRYIWQLKDYGELEVWHKVCDNPETEESMLIDKFNLPFANLTGGKNNDFKSRQFKQ